MLTDKSQAVRREAVTALGTFGSAAATYAYEVACLLLSDPSGKVRSAAAKALGALGESGRPYASAVAMQLSDVDAETRSEACLALGQMGQYGLAFAEELENVMQDHLIHPPEVKASAKQALILLGRLQEAVEDGVKPVPSVVKAALAAPEVQHQKALLHQEEATAANFKAQLERAESMAQHSEKASRELQEWMVRSLNEVNLSAHPSGEPRGRQFATEPSRDALLELPEGMEVQDPPFSFVLAHLVSHTFHVEAEAEGTEGDVGVQDFDPLESLSRYHEGDAPHTSNVLLLTRDELEGFAEGGTFAAGMRRKAEAEFLCRRRKKVNEARQKAIDDGGSMESDDSEMDLIVIVSGYPSTPEEVDELEDAGLFDLADAFVSIHLAGETLIDEPDETGATRRIAKMIGAPPAITALREKVLGAESGTPLASTIVTELYNCHEWALSQGFEVIDPCRVIVGAISFAAQRRISYKEWLSALPEDRVVIPSVDPIERTDTSVYERLVESTDPAHHDVSFMLYCLCEQVNQSLKGDTAEVPAARQKPSAEQMKDLAEKELAMIEKLLDNTCDGLLLGQDAAKKSEDKSHEVVGSLMAMVEQEEMEAERNRIYKYMPSMPVVELERLLLLREFQHLLHEAQPERQWNLKDWVFQEKISASLLSQTILEASCRDYFVNMKYMERQDCLLVAMHYRALPGRVLWHSWEGDLLTLSQEDGHQGQERFKGELKLCPMPTFHDWWQLVSGQPSPAPPAYEYVVEGGIFKAPPKAKKADARGGNMTQRPVPPPLCPKKVLDLDAREVGYCKVIEKILVPSDKSIILRTAFQRGAQCSVPELAKEGQVVKPAASLEDVPASSLSSLVRWTFFAHDLQMFPSYTANLTQFKAGSRTASDTLLAEVVEDEDEGEDSGLEEDEVLVDPFVPLPRKSNAQGFGGQFDLRHGLRCSMARDCGSSPRSATLQGGSTFRGAAGR
eukprot:g21266.t1